jgi:hypothetical protein
MSLQSVNSDSYALILLRIIGFPPINPLINQSINYYMLDVPLAVCCDRLIPVLERHKGHYIRDYLEFLTSYSHDGFHQHREVQLPKHRDWYNLHLFNPFPSNFR